MFKAHIVLKRLRALKLSGAQAVMKIEGEGKYDLKSPKLQVYLDLLVWRLSPFSPSFWILLSNSAYPMISSRKPDEDSQKECLR